MSEAADCVTLANAAAGRRAWTEALKLWDSVIEALPQKVDGYLGKGQALREMGRLDEAETVFADTLQRFPNDLWASENYAGIASRRGDWSEALRRYETVCSTFPDREPGFLGKGEALLEMGQFSEAEAVLSEAAQRFPASEWAASSWARVATRKHDWNEALRRWRTVRDRFPPHAAAHLGVAEALQNLERLDEADQVLAEATQKLPANEWLAFSYAQLAMHRCDWKEAARRWDLMLARFSHHPRAVAGKARALIEADHLAAVSQDDDSVRAVHEMLALGRRQAHISQCVDLVREAGFAVIPEKFSAPYLMGYHFEAETIVDIGVHSGTKALYNAFADRRFVLVEPLPGSEEVTRKNFPLLDIDFFPCAAGAAAGEAEFRIHNDIPWFSGFFSRSDDDGGTDRKLRVPVQRLDAILSNEKYGRPFGVKIDVEGFELQVLEGLGAIASDVEFLIIESHLKKAFASTNRFSDLIVKLKQMGFELADILTVVNHQPMASDFLFLRRDDMRFNVAAGGIDQVDTSPQRKAAKHQPAIVHWLVQLGKRLAGRATLSAAGGRSD